MKRLKEVLKELDQTINLYKITEKTPFLVSVIETMNKTLSMKVDERDIRRVLFFVSELFDLKWVSSENDYKLVINFPSMQELNESFPFLLKKKAEERLKVFDQKCMHYLKQLKKQASEDPSKVEGEIPFYPFPQKPNEIKGRRVSEIVQDFARESRKSESQVESHILTKLRVQGLLRDNKKFKEPLTNKEKVDELRQKIFARISIREEELKETLQREGEKETKVTEETRDIARRIFLHYKLRQVENMFLISVINHL